MAHFGISAHLGTSRRIPAHLGAPRCIPAHPGACRRISAHLGSSRRIQAHLGASRRIPAHPGASWVLLVPVSRFTFHVSRFTFHVSRFTWVKREVCHPRLSSVPPLDFLKRKISSTAFGGLSDDRKRGFAHRIISVSGLYFVTVVHHNILINLNRGPMRFHVGSHSGHLFFASQYSKFRSDGFE